MSRPPLRQREFIRVPALRADGRPAYEAAPEPVRALVTMADWKAARHNRPGLLARLKAKISPKVAVLAPAAAEVKEEGVPVNSPSSTISDLRTVPVHSPTRPGDPTQRRGGTENQELRTVLVPSTFSEESGDSARAVRR